MTKEELVKEINRYAKQMILQILRDYQESLGIENDQRLRNLLTKDFVVLDETTFPKKDDLVHIYLDQEDLNGKSYEEMEILIKKNILVRELFRYIITPQIESEQDIFKKNFASALTEGLLEKYAEEFSLKHDLGKPARKNEQNYALATELLNGIPKDISKDALFFQYQYPFMLEYYKIGTGQELLTKYENQEFFIESKKEPEELKLIKAKENENAYSKGFLRGSCVIVICLILGFFMAYLMIK
mgnify:CR=1 FL=1